MGNSSVKPEEIFISGDKLPDWDVCISAIKKDPSILKCRDNSGRTPLHRALEDKNVPDDVVSFIMDHDENASFQRDNAGFSPLHSALSHRRVSSATGPFRTIYSMNPDSSKLKSNAGQLPLHLALSNRADTEVIRQLVESHPEGTADLFNGNYPIHIAIIAKCPLETIEILVEHFPAGVGKKGTGGFLPLHLAVAIKPPLEYIKFLVQRYPDALWNRTSEGKMPLHYALEKQAGDDLIAFLVESYPTSTSIIEPGGNYPLHTALNMHYSFDVIDLLVQEFPGGAGIGDANDVLPLRKAVKDRYCDDVILCLLAAFPAAVQEVDEYERYAVHYAASRNYSDAVMSELIRIFPSAVRMCDRNGQLPLHIAMLHQDNYDVIQHLVLFYPEGTLVTDDKGYLPLHYGIENMYETEVLAVLIMAGKAAAQYLCKGRLALHMCIEFKHSFATIDLILEAYQGAISVKAQTEAHDAKHQGILPLHLALERQLSEKIILYLLRAFDDAGVGACGESTDRHGLFPIHYAVKYHSSLDIVKRLLKMFPGIVEMRYPPTGDRLLLHYAADENAPAYAIAEILRLTMPFRAKDGQPNCNHFYTWTFVLAETQDRYHEAVDIVLRDYKYEYVRLLNNFPDAQGRKAIDLATPMCKAEILRRLYFFGRYELRQEEYVHRSVGSLVRFALDHKASIDTSTSVGMPGAVPPKLVALKFMKFEHEFNRELSIRSNVAFDERYVIGFLRCYDGDADSEYRKETQLQGYEEYPYLIVLEAAQCNLEDIMRKEYMACKDWHRLREYCRVLISALQHVHDKGFIHGDIKPTNVLRLAGDLTKDNKYYHQFALRLCDFGGSISHICGYTTGIKCSPAYVPPEMVYSIPMTQKHQFNGMAACIRRSPNNIDVLNNRAIEEANPTNPEVLTLMQKEQVYSTAYAQVLAHPSQDMWSLGVLLYEMFSGMHLFIKSDEDNIDSRSLSMLCEWTNDVKNEKLSKIPDLYARNLVYQLLSKDPVRRPTCEKVLQLPFLTKIAPPRVPQQPPTYDVYICCRADIEMDCCYAEALYRLLTERGLCIHLEKHTVMDGRDDTTVNTFCDNLALSRTFMPVVSHESIRSESRNEYNWEKVTASSALDCLLLDCRLAMELYHLQMIEHVFPVCIGERISREEAEVQVGLATEARAGPGPETAEIEPELSIIAEQTEKEEEEERGFDVMMLSERKSFHKDRKISEHERDVCCPQEQQEAPPAAEGWSSVPTNWFHAEYFAAYRHSVIGKFGGSHPNAPDVVMASLESTVAAQLDRLRLGVPRFHAGQEAVEITRSAITDWEDYIVVGVGGDRIAVIAEQVHLVLCPPAEEQEELNPALGRYSPPTAGVVCAPSDSRQQALQPSIAVGAGAGAGASAAAVGTVASAVAGGAVAVVDINIMSDSERTAHVNKLTTEISSARAEIAVLRAELASANLRVQMKTQETVTLRQECNLPMPFIDDRSPQTHWR